VIGRHYAISVLPANSAVKIEIDALAASSRVVDDVNSQIGP